MIPGAVLALALLTACGFQLEDDDPPAPPAARVQDPRCLPGGTWSDSLAECLYPNPLPPAPIFPQ